MAPTPPPTSTTWPHRHRTFLLRPLALLVLAIVRPASSQQQLLQPPPGAATVSSAFSPPSPPPPVGGDGTGGRFAVTTSLLFIGVIVALFVLGFFSAYLRRCSGADGRRGGALAANAAAAAFASASAASGGRRRAAAGGLDAAAMEALPVLTYATARAVKAGRGGGALECAVCLSAFDDAGEKLRLLPGCCHVFHAACIDAWLAAHVTCPVCRADLSDPAVADAGHVLTADLAAAQTDTAVVIVNVDGSAPAAAAGAGAGAGAGARKDTTSMSSSDEEEHAAETAEERVDRFTLRLPERLRREIDEAKRLRRALSAVTASTALPAMASGGGALTSSSSAALRTMSAAARPSRRWSSGLFRALSGSWRMTSEPADGHRRVVPLPATNTCCNDGKGEVEVVVVRDDMDKYYAHSLTFAGFVIDGDVAASDWNPEVFQVKTDVPDVVMATSQR